MKFRDSWIRNLVMGLLALDVAGAADVRASESAASEKAEVARWCELVKKEIGFLKWKIEPCQGIQWKVAGKSVKGYPLVYAEFGNADAKNTSLVLAMVHSDEITPLYLGIQLAQWMRENKESLPNTRVILAPLVNPDGLFKRPRTRVNARGVDVNRNFATSDWNTHALAMWKKKFRSAPRRFPGHSSNSEPETMFQVDLIKLAKPKKILSIHAPLNMMDYDGPSTMQLDKFPSEYVQECLKLRSRLKAVSSGFFPGSLGNYAGQELGIPTLTLELPTADPRKAEAYWKKFKSGIRTMIEFKMPDVARLDSDSSGS